MLISGNLECQADIHFYSILNSDHQFTLKRDQSPLFSRPHISIHIFFPTAKLREDNTLSCLSVILSVHEEIPPHVTTSDLLKFVHLGTPLWLCPPNLFKLVHLGTPQTSCNLFTWERGQLAFHWKGFFLLLQLNWRTRQFVFTRTTRSTDHRSSPRDPPSAGCTVSIHIARKRTRKRKSSLIFAAIQCK